MSMRADNLMEHPEGGRFREVFRSGSVVTTSDGQSRKALTHIYFSLNPGEVSRFHRVAADEVWNLYWGRGLRLYTFGPSDVLPACTEVSAETSVFCHVVPAGTWQAAEPIGGTVLAGCSVGPGFEFEDFEIIEPGSDDAVRIQAAEPAMSRFVQKGP